MFDLTGHVALVTGGNSGLGLAFARGLARAGADLALWGRNRERNEQAASELRALGATAEAFAVDVSREPQVVEGMGGVLERFGRVDSCFANAGYTDPRPFLELGVDTWNEVLAVNLTGVFLCFREFLRHVVERGGGGKAVAVSSIGSLHGMPMQAHYSASKGAVAALVRSVAVEFARHDVQANAVMPGWIDTPATAPAMAYSKLHDAVVHRTPAHRWGRPEDLEGLAVYLASEESRFHTGDVIRVDGGYCVF